MLDINYVNDVCLHVQTFQLPNVNFKLPKCHFDPTIITNEWIFWSVDVPSFLCFL